MVKNQKKKTRADHSEDALYREVWEEVHIQKIYAFARRNIRWFLVGAVLLIIMVTSVMVVRHVRQANMMEIAARFESAMDMNPVIAREALLRVANSTRGGMGDLALFRSYQFALALEDEDGAIETLERLIERGSTRDFRDLARIQMVLLRGDHMSAADFQKLLAPTMTKRSPFYYTGLLLMAQKYISEDRHNDARPLLRKILSDSSAPVVIAAIAEQLER